MDISGTLSAVKMRYSWKARYQNAWIAMESRFTPGTKMHG